MYKLTLISWFILFSGLLISVAQGDFSKQENLFKNPPKQFYPMPFWHINGELTQQKITGQMTDAKEKAKFCGVAVLPLCSTQPRFLSDAYFEQYQNILQTAKKLDMNVILYDDIDFPSGTAGGQLYEQFPNDLRKELNKNEITQVGPSVCKMAVPKGKFMAAVAMNTETMERINLNPFIKADLLEWKVPPGSWKVMVFTCNTADTDKAHLTVDYLDTTAIRNFQHLTYDKYAQKFGSYLGNTIQLTFFDDVGFWHAERTWTNQFNEKFRKIYNYDPDLYYPVLWYNIGPETESARVAFFNTRAELLAEGYPRMASQWAQKQGLKSTGHAPDNYGLQPVAMSADIFKYHRYMHIPLADYIINYDRGRDGFKLISSASDLYDRPITAVEIYGAFNEDVMDSLMLYRALMEVQVRGINFVIPHGMWYNPEKVGISPLISPFSKKLLPALPAYSDYVGRSCYLLQGGRRIADIALLYPITSLEAGYYFDSPDKVSGRWAYPEADYQKISGMLTNEIQRDFTFVHPEYLATDKYSIKNGQLHLKNAENFQDYKLMIIPGGKVISAKALQKIKQFYNNGGKVIATTLLPSVSAEPGKNQEVVKLIAELFGVDAAKNPQVQSNKSGGKALYIPNPTTSLLAEVIASFLPDGDVLFEGEPVVTSKLGHFSYLHKVSKDKDIFFFANSGDNTISTEVLLRGKHQLKNWNPYTGEVSQLGAVSYFRKNGQTYTKYKLDLPAVKSIFWVSQ